MHAPLQSSRRSRLMPGSIPRWIPFCLAVISTVHPAFDGNVRGESAQPILAVQLFDLPFRSESDFDATFSRLRGDGVTLVIMRCFDEAGVYYPTASAPLIRDLLTPACRAARRQGLQLFAWMTSRSCRWLAVEHPEWCDRRYDPADGRLVRTDRLDIFHPGCRERLIRQFTDLGTCPIDGILFQDDFVMRQTEGFSDAAASAYHAATGRRPSGPEFFTETNKVGNRSFVTRYGPGFFAWRRWKVAQLLRLQGEIMARCRSIRPGLKFALNCFYETLTDPDNGRTWLSQDLSLARTMPFDLFSFMAYHRQIAEEKGIRKTRALRILTDMVATAREVIGDDGRILMKVQTKNWNNGDHLRDAEILAAVRSILDAAIVGIAVAPWRDNVPTWRIGQEIESASGRIFPAWVSPLPPPRPSSPDQAPPRSLARNNCSGEQTTERVIQSSSNRMLSSAASGDKIASQ